MSRHQVEAHLVVSDGAERKAIINRQMLGAGGKPSQEDVIRNIATNLSRFAEKRYATVMIEKATHIQRGVVRSFMSVSEAAARHAQRPDRTDATWKKFKSAVSYKITREAAWKAATATQDQTQTQAREHHRPRLRM
jgi:hypothetical protein